jgi:ArsR family transcriptional regulator
MPDNERYQYMTEVLKAMAHPSRLFILDQLHKKEHSVGELQKQLAVDISTVSKHLLVLRNAGIIASRKVNNQVFYRLLTPCVLEFYSCMSAIKKD